MRILKFISQRIYKWIDDDDRIQIKYTCTQDMHRIYFRGFKYFKKNKQTKNDKILCAVCVCSRICCEIATKCKIKHALLWLFFI